MNSCKFTYITNGDANRPLETLFKQGFMCYSLGCQVNVVTRHSQFGVSLNRSKQVTNTEGAICVLSYLDS